METASTFIYKIVILLIYFFAVFATFLLILYFDVVKKLTKSKNSTPGFIFVNNIFNVKIWFKFSRCKLIGKQTSLAANLESTLNKILQAYLLSLFLKYLQIFP